MVRCGTRTLLPSDGPNLQAFLEVRYILSLVSATLIAAVVAQGLAIHSARSGSPDRGRYSSRADCPTTSRMRTIAS